MRDITEVSENQGYIYCEIFGSERKRYIARSDLISAVEDYIEDKEIGEGEASRLRKLASYDGKLLVSSGEDGERLKPYLLPFLVRE